MELSVSEKVRLLLARQKRTLGEIAELTGQTRQNLSNKMSRGNFTEREIHAIAKALGGTAEIKFIFPDGTEF